MTFTTILLTLSMAIGIQSECTDMIFMESRELTTYHKRSGTTSFPSLDWTNRIANVNLGTEIYDPLDFSKYELMTHASNSGAGVLVYRVCEKNTDYTKYGRIVTFLKQGYLIKSHSITALDIYLNRYHFKTYGTPYHIIAKAKAEERKLAEERYAKKFPMCDLFWKYISNIFIKGFRIMVIGFGCSIIWSVVKIMFQ
jgi:hypothetical protein